MRNLRNAVVATLALSSAWGAAFGAASTTASNGASNANVAAASSDAFVGGAKISANAARKASSTLRAKSKTTSDALSEKAADFSLPTDVPLGVGSASSVEFGETILKAASSSLSAGMPALAQNIAEDAMKLSLSPVLAAQIERIYADSLIAQGSFEEAEKFLSEFEPSKITPRDRLRMAIVSAGMGHGAQALKQANAVDVSKLPEGDIGWYRLARGYAYFGMSNFEQALAEFSEAEKSASTLYMRADIDVAKNMCRLSEDYKPSDGAALDAKSLLAELEGKVNLFMGTPAGFQFAKQYVALLFRSGNTQAAFDAIETQLGIQFAQEVDKDELRLIGAAMTSNPEKRAAMLMDILRQTTSPAVADFALVLLSHRSGAKIDGDSYAKFLDELLKNASDTLRDRILMELAKMAIRDGDTAGAVKYSTRLIEEYPASKFRSDALRILAWASFSAKSAQYRLAASYLSELADLETDRTVSMGMKILAADCYYLNKDYATAAKIYASLFSRVSHNRGVILQKGVNSYLMTDDVDSAVALLREAYVNKNVDSDSLWNAEWRIISKYVSAGLREKAFERIDSAIESDSADAPLPLRMMWLKARLLEEDEDFSKAEYLCGEILSKVETSKNLDAETAAILSSNTRLLRARCLEASGKFSGAGGAFEEYAELRKLYPASDAALLSYLYEARVAATGGDNARAQNLCLELVGLNPKGKHAYTALFEAAQYARRLGMDADYRSAISYLDRLCTDFPNDPRNYYARLQQAEILRLINAFSDARSLYNEIINRYPGHPEIYLAWLGLGDASLAQGNKISDAVAVFEKLYSLPDMSAAARAEVAYKWAFALERAGRVREANEVRWMTSSKLLEGDANPHGSLRYWLGRNLYSLARSLEASGNLRDARAAYELIVKYKLPSLNVAEQKLKTP